MVFLKKIKSLIDEVWGSTDILHLVFYIIPMGLVLPFYAYCLVHRLIFLVFGTKLGATPSIDLVFSFFQGLILGPTQFNLLVIVWNCLVLACGFLFFFNATIITPLLLLFVIFKMLSLPFKENTLHAFGEFLIGLLGGASIYLILSLFSEETSVPRIIGAVIGFCVTIILIVNIVSG